MLHQKYLNPVQKAAADKAANVRPFKEAPISQENIPMLDLEAVDLSGFSFGPDGLENRKNLAKQLEKALTKYGFFKITGHGISEDEFNKMKSIGQSIFEIPEKEKQEFEGGNKVYEEETHRDLGVIRGNGFKLRGHWGYQNNRRDNIEFFNVRHFNHDDIFFNKIEYPEFVKYHLDDISSYFKYLHNDILKKILTLLDIILELPEGFFWENYFKIHNNNIIKSGGGFGRFLLYHEVDKEYSKQTNGTWLRGHSDGTALTFIASQPIASLQIRDHTSNEWKYVKHTPNSFIVNIGDAFKLITGDYFKSSIHRVTTPPQDQADYKRNTIVYFCDPRLDAYIDVDEIKSPKLKRLGITRDTSLERLTFEKWDEAKGKFLNAKNKTTFGDIKMFGRDTVMSLTTEGEKLSTVAN